MMYNIITFLFSLNINDVIFISSLLHLIIKYYIRDSLIQYFSYLLSHDSLL